MAEVSGGVYQASAYVVPRGDARQRPGEGRSWCCSRYGWVVQEGRGGLPSAAGTGYDKDQASASFAQ